VSPKDMKTLFTICLIVVFVGSASGSIIVLKTFDDLCGNYTFVQSVQMSKGENLLYQDLDPNTVDSPVGLDATYWHFGYVDFDGPNTYFVGWGRNSGYFIPGKSGYIGGKYTEYIKFDPEKRPDELFVVHDRNRDGIGTFNTVTGAWTLGPDDTLYTSRDVLFGPELVRGDVSLLPVWDDISTTLYLPKMVMKPFTDVADLIELSSFWLAPCSGANAWCNGADWNYDGVVNMGDFAVLAFRWLDYPLPTPLQSDMVFIPDGGFAMGDSLNEGSSNERPVHSVTLDPYAMGKMGKYEITNKQYCDFLNSAYTSQLKVVNGVVYAANDSSNIYPYCDTSTSSTYSQIAANGNMFSVLAKGERDMSKDPMVMVSWFGSVAYCNWRSQQEGKPLCYDLSTWKCDFSKNGYRLPTESEWEYAARGGVVIARRFTWGDTISHTQANYNSTGSYSYDVSSTEGYHPTWSNGAPPYTSPVGYFPPSTNAFGLCDMVGNVREWCNDWYGTYIFEARTDPTGPTTGTSRIIRGGSWVDTAYTCRVACRGQKTPSSRSYNIGFRVVVDLN
jgi:formylglycine-generating enzyme required for sulfatase activity